MYLCICQGLTRYTIDIAPTGRATCSKSHKPIPKGSVRWSVKMDGIARGGSTLLANVTPVMLKNAIQAHGSIDQIHGFAKFLSNDESLRTHVLTTLRDIARSGGKKKAKKGKAKKGKKGEPSPEEEEEDDDELLEMAALSLDDILERKFKEAKAKGDVMLVRRASLL